MVGESPLYHRTLGDSHQDFSEGWRQANPATGPANIILLGLLLLWTLVIECNFGEGGLEAGLK